MVSVERINKSSKVKKISKNLEKQQVINEQKKKEENINYGRCCR